MHFGVMAAVWRQRVCRLSRLVQMRDPCTSRHPLRCLPAQQRYSVTCPHRNTTDFALLDWIGVLQGRPVS
jgi:hypothetical protein